MSDDYDERNKEWMNEKERNKWGKGIEIECLELCI